MSIDQAIEALLAELHGDANVGKTATPGERTYEAAAGFRFARCDCTYSDHAYGWHEYIAIGTEGKHVVAINLNSGSNYGVISVGSEGFHTWPDRRRACH